MLSKLVFDELESVRLLALVSESALISLPARESPRTLISKEPYTHPAIALLARASDGPVRPSATPPIFGAETSLAAFAFAAPRDQQLDRSCLRSPTAGPAVPRVHA